MVPNVFAILALLALASAVPLGFEGLEGHGFRGSGGGGGGDEGGSEGGYGGGGDSEIKHQITYHVIKAAPVVHEEKKIVDYHTHPKYEFKYAVDDHKTGDKKERKESRDGDQVKGEYSLVEPDGTIRVVTYTADHKTGFNAVVKRIGKAHHPQIVHHKTIAIPVITKHESSGFGGF